jgi:peptidoglycan L-alanyl-D-glutamate endopeptidase CwlK
VNWLKKCLLSFRSLMGSKAGRLPTSPSSSDLSTKNFTTAQSITPKAAVLKPSSPSEAKASGWQADPRSEKNLATVQPQLQKLGRELLRRLAAEGLTFKVIQGRRTQAEQDALWAKGRTKPGPKVTWTRNSRHLTGRAIDLALFSGKNVVWESKHYTRAGEIGEQLGLVWGGRWKGGKTDKPHFELPA